MHIMLNVTDYPTWQKEVNLVEIIERDAQDRPLQTRTHVSAMRLKTSYVVRYAYPAPGRFEYHLVRGDLMTKNDFTFTVVADAAGESQVTVTQDTATKASKGSSATSPFSRISEISVATTLAPSRHSRSAVARPIPKPAPVTMTVFPENRPGMVSIDMAMPF